MKTYKYVIKNYVGKLQKKQLKESNMRRMQQRSTFLLQDIEHYLIF